MGSLLRFPAFDLPVDTNLYFACRERAAARIQLISDLCDLTVPVSALGIAQLDDGLVGLAGTVSSLIGVWSQWRKTA
jgi:hypothetical protein